MANEFPNATPRFKISTLKSGYYYVSIPNYEGGEVVKAEAYDALRATTKAALAALEMGSFHESESPDKHAIEAIRQLRAALHPQPQETK